MDELAQGIRRLACDLCPGEPLGEKRRFASGFFAFAAVGNDQNLSKCGKSGFHLHQSASGRYGCFEKTVPSLSEEHGADGIPNFIWSPHLTGMG